MSSIPVLSGQEPGENFMALDNNIFIALDILLKDADSSAACVSF
jgi:hypothetical protein